MFYSIDLEENELVLAYALYQSYPKDLFAKTDSNLALRGGGGGGGGGLACPAGLSSFCDFCFT